MSSQPLISVCIPCFNGEEFIALTLESALTQSLTNFEIVIIDDKSTDRTVSIIKRFTDPRIRLAQNDHNLGMGLNWNKALSRARGKYVKLLGQDDVLYPECLSQQVRILEDPSNSGAVLAICNREVIDSHDHVILRRKSPFVPGLTTGAKLIRSSIRWGTNLIGEPAVGLFRREALAKTPGCDPSNPYCSDLTLWAELLKHGDAFVDSNYLAAFRISGKATSAKIGRRQGGYFRTFIKSARGEKKFQVSWLDSMLGYVLSFQWCLARNLFMTWHSRRPSQGSIGPGSLSHNPTLKRLPLPPEPIVKRQQIVAPWCKIPPERGRC